MYFIVAMVIVFLLYCLNPIIRCGYRTARKQLLITIKEIFISPFGRVRFRDFFFADVITSMGEPLKDMASTVYYLKHLNEEQEHQDSKHNPYFATYLIIASFIPYWFRFWQCWNKYYYTGLNAHVWNAGKYFSKLIPPFVVLFSSVNK